MPQFPVLPSTGHSFWSLLPPVSKSPKCFSNMCWTIVMAVSTVRRSQTSLGAFTKWTEQIESFGHGTIKRLKKKTAILGAMATAPWLVKPRILCCEWGGWKGQLWTKHCGRKMNSWSSCVLVHKTQPSRVGLCFPSTSGFFPLFFYHPFFIKSLYLFIFKFWIESPYTAKADPQFCVLCGHIQGEGVIVYATLLGSLKSS